MNVEAKGNTLVVSGVTDANIKNQINLAPDGKRYNPWKFTWTLPATCDNMRFLQSLGIGSFDKEIAAIEAPLKRTGAFKIWPANITPFDHQIVGVDYLQSNEDVYMGWDMGLGKTVSVIVGGEFGGRVLIVCPRNIVRNWVNEMEKYSNMDFSSSVDPNDKTTKKLGKVSIIHYESLLSNNEIAKIAWDTVIIDEAHRIKSASAKRSKVLHGICARASRRILMSGTPITQGAEDIFSQWLALDGGKTFGKSFAAFKRKYFTYRNVIHRNGVDSHPEWTFDESKMPELRKKMGLRMDRKLKRDCLDLPPKNYQKIYVEMTPEQKAAYKEMKTNLRVTLNSGETVTTKFAIVQLQKLNQITSGFIYKDGVAHRLDSNKMKVLRETIEGQKKVVVWCLFKEDIRAVMAEFPEMNPVGIADWKRFQEDGSVNLLVGQVHVEGLNLTASELVIYYSQGYSLTDRLQSEDRTHRIGTKGMVTYIDLICPGTVDEDIVDVLERKRMIANELTGDNMTMEVMKKNGFNTCANDY